jgi:hypothetical protein
VMCRRMTAKEREEGRSQERSPDDCWQGSPGEWWPPAWLSSLEPGMSVCCDEPEEP